MYRPCSLHRARYVRGNRESKSRRMEAQRWGVACAARTSREGVPPETLLLLRRSLLDQGHRANPACSGSSAPEHASPGVKHEIQNSKRSLPPRAGTWAGTTQVLLTGRPVCRNENLVFVFPGPRKRDAPVLRNIHTFLKHLTYQYCFN